MLHIFREHQAIHGPENRSFSTDDVLVLQKGDGYLVVVNVRPEGRTVPTPQGWKDIPLKDLRSGGDITLGEDIALSEYQFMLLKK